MSYTLGATHALAGTGSIAVTSPIGLKYTVAAPAWLGSRFGTPPELVHAGRLALGNTDGYLPPLELTHAAGLFLPLPLGMTVLGYTMQPGVTAEVRELVDAAAPAGARLMPWDRNPLLIAKSFMGISTQTGGWVTLWTYTVPAGRKLFVASAHVAATRWAVATNLSITYVQMIWSSNVVLDVPVSDNVIGHRTNSDLGSGSVLGPGSSMEARWLGVDTGGQQFIEAQLTGFLFDD